MATNTYVALKTTTVTGSATSTIDFTSIPATYTDLVIVTSAKNLVADNAIFMTFNGDSTTNYSNTIIFGGTPNGTGSGRGTSQNYCVIGRTNTAEFCVGVTHVQNYANTTTNKTILSRGGNAGNFTLAYVNLWRNSTDPINRITLTSGSGNFEIGSSATIYGIANSNIGAPKAFGGTIVQDTTYTYHIFGASGTFAPQQSLTCDYLVVAGGGAGGWQVGGGGGGGGLRSSITATGGGGSLESPISLTAQNYTITVGAGGTVVTSNNGNPGGPSSIAGSGLTTITSLGGGGGSHNAQNASSGGGSGGGGANANGGSAPLGAAGTANQGFAGGNGNNGLANDWGAGGGGGGAGSAGTAATAGNSNIPGPGGNGVAINVAGALVYYAGGGGGFSRNHGAIGGLGGGGKGANGQMGLGITNATAGAQNTGGGGGGGFKDSTGDPAAGGSGIVVIRYATA